MKKLICILLIVGFVSLYSFSQADLKNPAIYKTLTAHIDDATGRIDAIDIQIKDWEGQPASIIILDYGADIGLWDSLNARGVCQNPSPAGGEGIRVYKNFPDTTNTANEIQGWLTTGCKVGDDKFRVYFRNASGDTLTFDPCADIDFGMGYICRTPDNRIPIFNPNGSSYDNFVYNWWPEYVDPPKPAFTELTLIDSIDGSWNTVYNDETYHDTDSCDYNYHWGVFQLCLNGDPASSYYLDLENYAATDANFKLQDGGYFPFYLDSGSVPSDFWTWWAAKGVTATATPGTWQAWMWEIINGNEPQFYVYYEENAGMNIYKLIDGLQHDYGMTDEYLRVNGDYPTGEYTYNGTITGCNNVESEEIYVKINFKPRPHIVDVTASTDVIDDCTDPFTVCIEFDEIMDQTIDPTVTYDPDLSSVLPTPTSAGWTSDYVYCIEYDTSSLPDTTIFGIDVIVSGGTSAVGCLQYTDPDTVADVFDIDTEIPEAQLDTHPNPVNGCYIDSTFTVTATYNDSMCLSVNPSITFIPDVTDPASADYTLELLPTPSWTPPNVFTWNYKIIDSDVDSLEVEIVVDGAKDWTCCNTQEPDTTDILINTDSPIVDSIIVSTPLLTRCDTSFTVCVYYDREMDPTYTPAIDFNPDVSSDLGSWSDSWDLGNTKYCREFGPWTMMPDIDHDCVDIMVSEGRGIVDTCSIQIPDTCFCCFGIDWDRPSVDSVYVSDLCVGSCDTIFTVTVEYDEPMCQTVYPTITFVGLTASPFTFDSEVWLDYYTAEITYTVADIDAYLCDVDILVEDAIDATCCDSNYQYPYTEYDAFDIDQLEPSSSINNAIYDTTDCTISFDWEAWDSGCPECIEKVEFYVWKDGGDTTLAYTDTTGNTMGTFEYDLADLQALNDTLCLEGMWYGYSKAYDCCCNVEDYTTLADDSVFVSVTATHFKINARDHVTQSDTLREGKLFDVEIIPVNDCGLRDCDFEGCIEGCTNYNFNIVNLTLFSNPTMIYDGYLLTENNVAHMTMDDLIIKAWLCPCCAMYSYSDPITVIYPPIEPPTNTSAYDIPNDQGGWISIDYELSLNDPFHSTHYPSVNPEYLPFIDYYVVARNSEPDGSGTWNAIAFVNLYDPVTGNNAHVDIQVPAGDTLYPYAMAAVCTDAKLFGDDDKVNLVNKKTMKKVARTENSPKIIYASEIAENQKGVKSSQSPWNGCGDAAGRDNIPGYTDMTVFLEGPYQTGGTMDNGMLTLPTISPYDLEDIGTLPTVSGHTLIDWIYVQLRSTSDGETVQEANAFVLENGKVVDTEGNYSLPFFYTSGKQFYIVVQHRNHLSIMSNQRKCFGDSPTESSTIDLTLAGSVWDDGFKEVETDIYAMYAGDANQNGQVQTSDKNDWWNIQVGQAGYKESDFNLNGQVQTSDVNDKWQYNVGASSKVPAPAPPKNANNNASRRTHDANNKSVGLTFYFENGFLAPDHSYYEFDVMIGATEANTRLGDTQVYLNYSTDGFGESIVENSKVTIMKGTLLQGDFGGLDLYSLLNMEDNTASKASITYQYNLAALLPTGGNVVPMLPATDQLMHIRIDIANENATAGLSFDISLMTGQQYQSDNLTANKYDPINAGNSDDHTLPVELSSFTAVFNSAHDNIKIEWNTATESNVLGFNIYRSENDDLSRAGRHINYSLLDAAGTTTEPQSYEYIDVVGNVYATHYYWLEVVDLGGTSSLHGPVAYVPGDLDGDMTPDLVDKTKLIGCWPNPAKNRAEIQYQIKGSVIDQNATISVYNILGELVAKVQGSDGVAELNTSEFAHGIYFYRLQTDDYTEIKKMIVVK